MRDIGRAEAGPADTTQAAWSNGKSSVFLVIWKQPVANVIDTVEAIKRALGPLQAAIPHDIQVKVLSDRTLTIRASVRDVEFTLMLTVALVVMVIFVFLRSVWTTVIPAVTIPLALLGACALMWAVGYSLDNLSLMAFTIAVGFVVDDAIVMLENILRAMSRKARGLSRPRSKKGSGEIGFTIISMSTSLIAVLMPLLMMSGLIGRLFPRIFGHDRDDDRGVRARFADALAHDGLTLSQEPRQGTTRTALQTERERNSSPSRERTSVDSISFCATASPRS